MSSHSKGKNNSALFIYFIVILLVAFYCNLFDQGADNPSSLMMSLNPDIKQEKDGAVNMNFQENNYYGEFQYIFTNTESNCILEQHMYLKSKEYRVTFLHFTF